MESYKILSTIQSWFHDLKMAENGILMANSGRFGIGAVLVVHHKNNPKKLLMIRKAQASGYEFSGKWALPGGMARSFSGQEDLFTILKTTLINRLRNETGIRILEDIIILPVNINPPLVSSYTAKGKKQHTVVIPFLLQDSKQWAPEPQDSSVDRAVWRIPIDDWENLAPANRIIIAHILWPYMDTNERDVAKPFLVQALTSCSFWAKEIGLPTPHLP